jgi:type IV pilus assembly protein PilV
MSLICKKLSLQRPLEQSGFSLLEVLVALLILSVGLLGLAGLQGRGLHDNNQALIRSRAVQCAEDILDRMRSNRTNAVGYEINLGTPDLDTRLDRGDLESALSGYAGIVRTDLVEWKNNLANSLPEGDGSIQVDATLTTVVIRWTENNAAQDLIVVTRL